MPPFRLSEQTAVWAQDLEAHRELMNDVRQVRFLAKELFDEYLPTRTNGKAFLDRLDDWLDQVQEPDQQLLLQLVSHIFFIGHSEMESLYLAAYRGPISQWLINQLNLDLDHPQLAIRLNQATSRTWFCPISDSMKINDFHTLNQITVSGHGARPDWYALHRILKSMEGFEAGGHSLVTYMRNNGLDRLVLLEDFVGSGEQMRHILKVHAELGSDPPTLIVPLVACPAGNAVGYGIARNTPSITYSPVLELPSSAFVVEQLHHDAHELFPRFRDIAERLARRVSDSAPSVDWHHLGHPPEDPTGALVVLPGNCPDNTLPLIHQQSASWRPLFPRVQRMNNVGDP